MGMPAEFVLEGSTLTASGELGPGSKEGFDRALRSLVATGEQKLTIDVRAVTYMSSSYIGLLMAALADGVARGVRLSIKASSRGYRLLKMAGVEHLGEIRVADE